LQLRVVDVGILERRSDARPFDSSLMPVRHPLQVHHFLVIGPVVVHDGSTVEFDDARQSTGRPVRTSGRHPAES